LVFFLLQDLIDCHGMIETNKKDKKKDKKKRMQTKTGLKQRKESDEGIG